MANQKSCKDHTEASLRNFKEQNFVTQNSNLQNFTEQNFTSNGENSSQNIKRPRQELSENKTGDVHCADEADTDAACNNETAYGGTCGNGVDAQAQGTLPACAEVLRARLSEQFIRGEIFVTLQGANRDNVRAVAIGNFDGMHLGHQKLFERLGEQGAIIVILAGGGTKLTPFASRQAFTDKKIFYCDLRAIKSLSGGEFIALLRQNFINLQKIVVGEDFRFGRDRAWGAEFLRREFSGQTCVVGEFCLSGDGVHSSRIKELLSRGQCEAAAEFLGRDYEICGRIVRGQGRGAREFVATLNLDASGYFMPKSGVYATVTSVCGARYKSVSFVGERLSTDGAFALETHILGDFAGFEAGLNSAQDRPPCCGGQAAYSAQNLDEISARNSTEISTQNFAASESLDAENKILEATDKNGGAKFACVKFIKFLRENRKFSDLARLKEQILKDASKAEAVLRSRKF
ncbi:riboflavin kinase [uncultured Campylobacter sp.]|mgnify:FL=1|uniref:riboflavin kinase n=1 Tax=uncultured Campylobacter sp. TaxID=218934 RepID=UPI00261A4279|nr:riboflavin kinase [uncultured Campylobacter sp.]